MKHTDQASPYFVIWKRIFLRYPHPIRDMLILAVVLAIHTLLSVGIPYLMKELVDQSQSHTVIQSLSNFWSWHNLYILAIAFSLGWLMMNLFNFLQNILSAYLNIKLETALLYSGLENYFKLKFSEQKKIETGVISSDLWRGADAFATITYTIFFVLMPIVFQVVVMVIVLAQSIQLAYALLFMVFATLIFVINIFITLRSQDIFTQLYDAHNQTNQFFVEKIQANYDIKINGALNYEMQLFDHRVLNFQHEVLNNQKKLSLFMVVQVLFVGLFLLTFMLITVYLFSNQGVTTGDFILISSYIVALTMPLLLMSQSVIRLKGNFIALNKLHDYFQIPHEQMKHEPIEDKAYFYQFQDASFYLGKHLISNFNYRFEKGKCYVAIGQTGIGKTSFINYLSGLEQVESGSLHYKNIDISQQFSDTIFEEVAVVSQLPIIYTGSFRQNLIHNSKHQYDDEELLTWLERFNLSHLLSKNQLSLDDDIQFVYKNFSGGEKQRISLIRALLKKPKFLIMDEPTAALDERMSLQVLQFIQSQVDSILMISHANFAQEIADEVINFDTLIRTNSVLELDSN